MRHRAPARDHHEARTRPAAGEGGARADHRKVYSVKRMEDGGWRMEPPTSNLQPPTSNLQPPTSNLHYVNSHHGLHRLRLSDVVPREVHGALPAGAHAAGESQLPRGLDGKAAGGLRAPHRLHA